MEYFILNILTCIFKITLRFFYFTTSKAENYVILKDNYYLICNTRANTLDSYIDILGPNCPNIKDIISYEKELIRHYNIKTKYRCNNCGEIFGSKDKLNKFGCKKCN